MDEMTKYGVISIVIIVVASALFFANIGRGVAATGEAYTGATIENPCEPARFCAGTKLHIVREDCSLAFAYCRQGCRDGYCI